MVFPQVSLKSWVEAVLSPFCYLDVNVMAGTLAAIMAHGLTFTMEVVSYTAWVSDAGVSVQPELSPFYVRQVSCWSHFFLYLCYWEPKENFAIIALRKRIYMEKRTHYLVIAARWVKIISKYLGQEGGKLFLLRAR